MAISDIDPNLKRILRQYADLNASLYDELNNYRNIINGHVLKEKKYEKKRQLLEDQAVAAKKQQLFAEKEYNKKKAVAEQARANYDARWHKIASEIRQKVLKRELAIKNGDVNAHKRLNEELRDLFSEEKSIRTEHNQAQAELTAAQETLTKSTNDLTNAEHEYRKETTLLKKATGNLKDAVVSSIGKFFTFGAGLASLQAGAKASYQALTKLAQTGIIFEQQVFTLGGMFDKMAKEPILLGLTAQEYAEVIATNRQAVNAVGGTTKAFEQVRSVATMTGRDFEMLSPAAQKLTIAMGGPTEASKYLYEQFTALGRAGIRPSLESVDQLAGSFLTLQRTVGMTGKEYNAMLNDIAEDDGIRAQLRAASDEKQRQALIKNYSALIATNTALGMTKEQAIEAAKSLGKIGGEKAVERIVKAQKFGAAARALGFDRETIMLAQQYMRAPALFGASTPQFEAYQRIRTEGSGKMAQMAAGAQGLGKEMAFQQVMGGLQMEGEFDPKSAIAAQKTTAEATKLSADQMVDLNKHVTEKLTPEMQKMGNAMVALAQAQAAFNNEVAQLVKGGMQISGAALYDVLGSLLGGVAGGAIGGKIAGRGAGKAAGGAAKVGGKALGKSLLKKIPLVGLGAGLLFGAGRAMEGDWLGATGEIASGAASTVPGIGTATSTAIDAGLAIRDATAEEAQEQVEQTTGLLTTVKDNSSKTVDILSNILTSANTQVDLSKQMITLTVAGNKEQMTARDLAERMERIKQLSASYNF